MNRMVTFDVAHDLVNPVNPVYMIFVICLV
jgi:hypothetical protein